ncbi:hypothetical protein RB195_024355 [Necator americanus]|uniref:Reverse transcriptase domain-containing protein n=1 Tax=Necator americanus TaxID=51031 RepID=A0ABR1EMZ1_NECAM
MVAEFNETCGCFGRSIGLQLNLQKTIIIRNGWVSDPPSTISGTNISECTSYAHLGREMDMKKDLTPLRGKRKQAA